MLRATATFAVSAPMRLTRFGAASPLRWLRITEVILVALDFRQWPPLAEKLRRRPPKNIAHNPNPQRLIRWSVQEIRRIQPRIARKRMRPGYVIA